MNIPRRDPSNSLRGGRSVGSVTCGSTRTQGHSHHFVLRDDKVVRDDDEAAAEGELVREVPVLANLDAVKVILGVADDAHKDIGR